MRSLLLLLLASFAPALWAQQVAQSIAKDDIVNMQDDDPAMRKAFQVARASLDDFLKLAKNPAANQQGLALKVGIMNGDDTEYFWITDFVPKGGGKFEGEINNEPRIVTAVKMGDRYTFSRSQIVDWLYVDEAQQKMVGNFTMCALLTQEPAEEAAQIRRRYKLDCSKVTD